MTEQDEREALARIIESLKWETFTAGDGEPALRRVPSEKVADAILAAGFHRRGQITEAMVNAGNTALAHHKTRFQDADGIDRSGINCSCGWSAPVDKANSIRPWPTYWDHAMRAALDAALNVKEGDRGTPDQELG